MVEDKVNNDGRIEGVMWMIYKWVNAKKGKPGLGYRSHEKRGDEVCMRSTSPATFRGGYPPHRPARLVVSSSDRVPRKICRAFS